MSSDGLLETVGECWAPRDANHELETQIATGRKMLWVRKRNDCAHLGPTRLHGALQGDGNEAEIALYLGMVFAERQMAGYGMKSRAEQRAVDGVPQQLAAKLGQAVRASPVTAWSKPRRRLQHGSTTILPAPSATPAMLVLLRRRRRRRATPHAISSSPSLPASSPRAISGFPLLLSPTPTPYLLPAPDMCQHSAGLVRLLVRPPRAFA